MGRRRTQRVEGAVPTGDSLRHAVPVEELDLHGYRTDEAVRRLGAFLQRVARQHPEGTVRVITGRGRNSPDGPRVRPAVLAELQAASEHVADWQLSLDEGSVLVRLR